MMLEMLSHGFMVRALMAGLIIGVLLALLSVPVVLKKLSFMGMGVAHSAFGGVAIGALLGVDITYSTFIFSTVVALCIGWLSRRGNIHEDVSVGIVFAVSMAIGVVCLGLMEGYYIDLFSYLFGSILAVSNGDLILAAIVFVIITLLLIAFSKEFLVYCFDEEWARVSGVNVDRLQDLLLVMIAWAVVVSIKLLGIVLVSALLVIPGAVGYLLAENYRKQYLVSIATAVLSTVAGLSLSYRFNIASGATIVLSAAFIFLCAALLSPKKN